MSTEFEKWWKGQGGHGDKEMDAMVWNAAIAAADKACMEESVDEGTGEPTDAAYNQACVDCAKAVSKLRPP